MEIYVNDSSRDVSVTLPITPNDNQVGIKVYEGDTVLFEASSASLNNGVYSFTLPFSLVTSPHTLRIDWTINYTENNMLKTVTTSTYVEVVIPLVSIARARDVLEIPSTISDVEIQTTERRVRKIIEEATGQVFAPITTTYNAIELSNGDLKLPFRLISTTSISGIDNSLYYVLADGGWKLAYAYPHKRDGMRAGVPDGMWSGGVPINPNGYGYRPAYRVVAVSGVWGYSSVPTDITEAALLLIEQKLCPDALYQERYVQSMTSADFRYQFADGAYSGTGNVVVDHLLRPYTITEPAVI